MHFTFAFVKELNKKDILTKKLTKLSFRKNMHRKLIKKILCRVCILLNDVVLNLLHITNE